MSSGVVQSFGKNEAGKDWIIGDVHGAFDLVWDAMKKVGFDRQVDRLFVAGDLVDRGAQSMRAKRFLEQSFVKAVRGNHEDWWLDLYENGPPEPEVVEALGHRMNMGVQWWLDAKADERDALVAMFAALPVVIEVETERGSVGIVHAEVPPGMNWDSFKAAVERGDEKTLKSALWGRKRIRADDQSGVQGVGRVFVGHTPQWGGLKRYGNVYAIDTGAVFGLLSAGQDDQEGKLTIAQLVAGTKSLAADAENAGAGHLVDARVAGASAVGAFGQYAVRS